MIFILKIKRASDVLVYTISYLIKQFNLKLYVNFQDIKMITGHVKNLISSRPYLLPATFMLFFPHKMSPYVNEFKYKILTSKIQRTQGKKVQA